MSSSSGSNGEQQDADVPVLGEYGENSSVDGGEGSSGGSGRVMEPAPPTYEEALSLFVRNARSNGASGSGDAGPPPAARTGRRQTISEDSELAERLQQEEFERCLRGTCERSASVTTGFSGQDRDINTRTDPTHFSISSAPDDFRSMRQPPHNRLRTIHENEEMVIDPTPHCSDSDSCGKACCYSSCFGFAIFTNRLSPTLRDAWKSGVKYVTDTSLPVFSTQSRYILFSIQALITAACITLSFVSTPSKNENLVRSVSLIACLIVNILERVISWCGCCQSKRKTYNAFSDITRNLLTDIFLYPAVIASIMNALNTQSYNVVLSLWDDSIYSNISNSDDVIQDDAINISMNVLVLLLFIVMVHILRLGQLGKIVKSLVGKFKENVSGARSTARVFIVIFFVHVFIESIIQILYLFLIGFRIHAEMTDPSQPQVFGVSVYLFIMMVCGELVPLLGIFMYFITAQKWVEEFPIALLLDHTPSNRSLSGTVHDRVEYQFKELHTFNMKCSGCLFGLLHPLVSPFQILIMMAFFALWALFVCTYPISSIDSTYLDLSLSKASSSLFSTVGIAVVYGLLFLLSFLVNLLPLIYGFLSLAMLPFWGIFYTFIGCSALCNTKS